MWKYCLALAVMVTVTAGAYGELECRDRVYPCPTGGQPQGLSLQTDGKARFDSLNVRFVGNWPFGPSFAVVYDSTRRLAFLGSGGGVYILDLSAPANPMKVSDAIRTRGLVQGLFYDNGSQRLYIAADVAGLEVWDISDQNLPVKLGGCDTPDNAYGVVASGSYAYIADGCAGLQIYQNLLVGVEETVLAGGGVRVLQNPIAGDYIHLSFELPQSDNINFSLYNIAGQRLKSFSPSPLSSNSHTVRLPLYELSNGIYFLRIKGMTLNETIKLIRVR